MNKQERRAYQEGLEADQRQGRPAIETRAIVGACPATSGKRHDFSMKGPDGKYRCWFCVRTRAQVEEA